MPDPSVFALPPGVEERLDRLLAEGDREAERLNLSARNPEACFRFGVCAFWQVCSAGLSPADFPHDFERHDDVWIPLFEPRPA